MDADRHKDQDEDGDVANNEEWLGGDEVGEEGAGDGVDLVAGADEDEGGEEDVDHRVVGDQHQHAVGVGTEPDVVLGDEQLQVQSAEPGEETERKTGSDEFLDLLCHLEYLLLIQPTMLRRRAKARIGRAAI